jgi:hypothetical protein
MLQMSSTFFLSVHWRKLGTRLLSPYNVIMYQGGSGVSHHFEWGFFLVGCLFYYCQSMTGFKAPTRLFLKAHSCLMLPQENGGLQLSSLPSY